MGARIIELHKPHWEVHMGPRQVDAHFPDQQSAEDRAEQEARSHRIVTVLKVHGRRRPVIVATWTDGERD